MVFSLLQGKSKSTPSFTFWILSACLLLYHRYLHLTTRIRHIGLNHIRDLDSSGDGFILLPWHGNCQAVLLAMFGNIPNGITILISRSPHGGGLIAPLIHAMGFNTISGSGTGKAAGKAMKMEKGGVQAFRNLLKVLRRGENISMTADIVPGPACQCGAGAVLLASHSGRPIIPIGAVAQRQKILQKAWDKHQIPLGFCPVIVVWGAPIYIKPDLSPDMVESECQRVTNSINECFDRAYAELDMVAPR